VLVDVGELVAREGDALDVHAPSGGVPNERSPARPGLQDAVARLEAQALEGQTELATAGHLERLVVVLEDARRVRVILAVQEVQVQVVHVVVGAHPLAVRLRPPVEEGLEVPPRGDPDILVAQVLAQPDRLADVALDVDVGGHVGFADPQLVQRRDRA
jgi:hypothetical protein